MDNIRPMKKEDKDDDMLQHNLHWLGIYKYNIDRTVIPNE
jgi:hypothetical protein